MTWEGSDEEGSREDDQGPPRTSSRSPSRRPPHIFVRQLVIECGQKARNKKMRVFQQTGNANFVIWSKQQGGGNSRHLIGQSSDQSESYNFPNLEFLTC